MAELTHKKGPWTRAHKLQVTGIIVGLLLSSVVYKAVKWFVTRDKFAPAAVRTQATTPTSIHAPAPGSKASVVRRHRRAVAAPGLATTTLEDPKIQGECNAVNNSGIGNTSTANCVPPKRHLTGDQKTALKSVIVLASIQVVLEDTNEEDSQRYGDEIGEALSLPPENQLTGFNYSAPGAPQGVTVRIHAAGEAKDLQQLAQRIRVILGADGLIRQDVPTGEIRIVVGRTLRRQ
jgi:hypothetical protein